jgi:hypothetical protein
MRGWRIDPAKVPELKVYLRKLGADEEAISNVVRLLGGMEIFQGLQQLLKAKHGDCDRLTCARLAELWLAGIMAGPYLIPFPNDRGGTTYHAVVIYPDGSYEDPSVLCHMPGDRAGEIEKNLERHQNLVHAAADIMLVDGLGDEDSLGAVIDAAGYMPRGGYMHPGFQGGRIAA